MADTDNKDDQGNEGGDSSIDLSSPEIKAAIDSALKEQTEALQSSLKKSDSQIRDLKKQLKEASGNLSQWEGMNPEDVKSILERFDNDEEMQLIKQGKHEDLKRRWTEKAVAEWKSRYNGVNKEMDKTKERAELLERKLSIITIDNEIQKEFAAEGGLPSAIPDITQRARAVFSVSLEGDELSITPRDDKGEIITGEAGQLSIKEWIGKMRKEAPHLFNQASGSGSRGSDGKTPPSSKKRSEMTTQEKVSYIKQHGSKAYEQLPY